MHNFFEDMKETKNVEHAIKVRKKIQISINSYTMAKNINASPGNLLYKYLSGYKDIILKLIEYLDIILYNLLIT